MPASSTTRPVSSGKVSDCASAAATTTHASTSVEDCTRPPRILSCPSPRKAAGRVDRLSVAKEMRGGGRQETAHRYFRPPPRPLPTASRGGETSERVCRASSTARFLELHIRRPLRTFDRGEGLHRLVAAIDRVGPDRCPARCEARCYRRAPPRYNRLRATAMRFSVPSSCDCSARKFWFDFRSG